MSYSQWIRKARRLAIYERDGWRCVWCRVAVTGVFNDSPHTATLDHVRSRVNGGSNKNENLVTCCHACNSKRRDRVAFDFAKELAWDWANSHKVDATRTASLTAMRVAVLLERVLAAITKPLAGRDARHIDRRQVAVVKRACTPLVDRNTPRKNSRRSND